jgi:predicted nucleic acid-binding Zn finger protein
MEKRVYKEGWSEWNDLRRNFSQTYGELAKEIPEKEPSKVFAVYDDGGYEGSALVIYVEKRKFYIVEASHCSCYGLEGQWEPTVHEKVELKKMLTASYGLFHRYSKEISEWMK